MEKKENDAVAEKRQGNDIDMLFYSNVKRLQLLENAIINYCDGIAMLELKSRIHAQRLAKTDRSSALFLVDISTYLHEVSKFIQR
ncbi:hypothetical protein ACMYSK_23730 [Klebsiella sp. I138]|uniref:hypothetical protein n=1 Tax=Klebsiella sp. I138 TaxID=2755385 RepID=UPI003DA8E015